MIPEGVCVLCGEPITESDVTDATGIAHLRCTIEEAGGCEQFPGVFVRCDECWEILCPYRCAPPMEVEVVR